MNERPEQPEPRAPNLAPPPEASPPAVATNWIWPEVQATKRDGRLGERILPSRVHDLQAAAKQLATADYFLGPGAMQPDVTEQSRARAAAIRRNRSKRRCAYITRAAQKIYQKLLEDEVRNSSLTCRTMAAQIRSLRNHNAAMRALIDSASKAAPQHVQSQARAQNHSVMRGQAATTVEMDPFEWKQKTDANFAGLQFLEASPALDGLTAGFPEQSWVCSNDLWSWPPH
jgi:hypothetical protein